MVPGLSERERLAEDLRRADWLADTVIGPSRDHRVLIRLPRATTPRREWNLPVWHVIAAVTRHVRHEFPSFFLNRSGLYRRAWSPERANK